MINRGYQVLTYDEENRLIQWNGPSPQVTFGYTDGGTRLWRRSNGADLTVWIGGIYENRGGKELCHVKQLFVASIGTLQPLRSAD